MKDLNTKHNEYISVKGRIEEYDYVKGLLIIFVIWGHVCAYSSTNDYDGNILTYIIRLFQMPMFILISGMFYKQVDDLRNSIGRGIKIFKHIGLPLFFWVAVTSITLSIEGVDNGIDIGMILGIIKKSFSVYWYFICLLLCMVFTMIMNIIFKNRKYLWGGAFTLWLIPVNIYNFQFLYLFFVLGIFLSEYKIIIIRKWERINWIKKILILIVISVGAQYYPTELTFYSVPNSIYNSIRIEVLQDVYFIPSIVFIILRYVIYTISTICWMLFFCELFQNRRNYINTYILSIGKETLFLFVSHLYLLVCFSDITINLCEFAGMSVPSSPYIRFYVVDVIVSSLLIMCLFKIGLFTSRFKTLSLLMQGKI